MILSGIMNILVYFLLVETRGSKILEDRARRLTLETGTLHLVDTDGSRTAPISMLKLIKTTASRPIVLLVTEPIIAAIATWIALLYVYDDQPPYSPRHEWIFY